MIVINPGPVPHSDAHRDLFYESLEAYGKHQLFRGSKPRSNAQYKSYLKSVAKITCQYSGAWTPTLLEGHLAAVKEKGLTTLWKRNVIESYSTFLMNDGYPWRQRFAALGFTLVNPITPASHRTHDALDDDRDVYLIEPHEQKTLLDYLDSLVDDPSPELALSAARDSMMCKVTLGFGTRRAETAGIKCSHFVRNVDIPKYGEYGVLYIARGKARPLKQPRHRTIYVIPLTESIVPVARQYVESIRPAFTRGNRDDLFVNVSGAVITPEYFGARFQVHRREAGLPDRITLHSLRRAYATQLAAAGVDGWFIAKMLGHDSLATTARYLLFPSDMIRRTVRKSQEIALRHDH